MTNFLSQKLDGSNSLLGLMQMLDPDHSRSVDLPRQIGFDRIIIASEVMSISWDVFEKALAAETTGARTIYAYECRTQEKILAICKGEPQKRWYSSIQIRIASNTLSLRKCNLPNCRDICRFEICIPPIHGHEVLGNISNLSCEEEQSRVLSMMDAVERYGIHLNRKIADIKEVELNVNLYLTAYHYDFRDALEIIRPYRQCLDGFTYSDYSQSVERKQVIHGELPQTRYPWSMHIDVPKQERTAFNATSSSRIIKVYDKSAETVAKADGALAFISPITRIEFVLKDAKEVPIYFNRKTNLFDMTQTDVEDAFHKLSARLIREPLNQFYRNWNQALEKYFERVDIRRYSWRKNLVMELDKMLKEEEGFLIITITELSRYVSLIPAPSVHKNRARITKSLQNEIRLHASCIRVTETDVYEELMDWLCNLKGQEEQNILYELT